MERTGEAELPRRAAVEQKLIPARREVVSFNTGSYVWRPRNPAEDTQTLQRLGTVEEPPAMGNVTGEFEPRSGDAIEPGVQTPVSGVLEKSCGMGNVTATACA